MPAYLFTWSRKWKETSILAPYQTWKKLQQNRNGWKWIKVLPSKTLAVWWCHAFLAVQLSHWKASPWIHLPDTLGWGKVKCFFICKQITKFSLKHSYINVGKGQKLGSVFLRYCGGGMQSTRYLKNLSLDWVREKERRERGERKQNRKVACLVHSWYLLDP